MSAARRHLDETLLIRRYLVDRGLAALDASDEAPLRHMAHCPACEARYQAVRAAFDETREAAIAGVDQIAVRKAIAIAVDYTTIIANAMTNQSATFDQVPRSLMNPNDGEQALFAHAAVADLQWAGNDIEGAKKLLDDAGIVDTDGDGWREVDGKNLSYIATCPNGWSDWQSTIMWAVCGCGLSSGPHGQSRVVPVLANWSQARRTAYPPKQHSGPRQRSIDF